MTKNSRLEPFYLGKNVAQVNESENISVFKICDNSGSGEMSMYHVFPGISLIYNDFHMSSCLSEFSSKVTLIGIDHCREGRIEWELPGGSFLYLQEGDLQIDSRIGSNGRSFGLPLKHYHGITIAIDVNETSRSLKMLLHQFDIDLNKIYEKFCTDKSTFIKRANESISHIFSVLYSVKGEHHMALLRVKVIEILLYLQIIDPSIKETRTYFPKHQVEIIKKVAELITSNLNLKYTIKELSEKYNIPTTTFKLCFKGVFGCPIGQYLREFKMNEAARLLKNKNDSVSAIAGKLGYDNSSKFAAAFKAVKGKSPTEYRKTFV